MNLFSVKDRVIVITGATGVLGRAMVSHFAEEGAKVVMLGRNVQRGTQIAEKARAAGGEAVFLATDVLDRTRLEGSYDAIMNMYGRIDVLINAAGGNMPGATIAPDKTFFDLDTDAVRQVVDLNLFGTVLPTMVFAQAMVRQKAGSIINIASEAGLRPHSFRTLRRTGGAVGHTAVACQRRITVRLRHGDCGGRRFRRFLHIIIIKTEDRTLLSGTPYTCHAHAGQYKV